MNSPVASQLICLICLERDKDKVDVSFVETSTFFAPKIKIQLNEKKPQINIENMTKYVKINKERRLSC